MSLRLGFGTRNDAGPGITAGVGWALRDFDLDYAFVPYGDLGVSHRLSVTWRFGEDAREAHTDRSRYEERKPRRKTDRTSPRKPRQADKRP
jgi:hypothetical protein